MHAAWIKSSHSNSFSNCIEVRADPDGTVAVRDSKDPSGPVLSFSPEQWTAFLEGIRNGELAARPASAR
jgi:hypothetical protein